ncbi:MAG: hypothetical protein ACK502_09185 [Alphaproteobacteria bacterium]
MMQEQPEGLTTNNLQHSKTKSSPHQNLKKRKRNKHDYQYWLTGPYNSARGETALWVAVITQAMTDALSNSRNPETLVHKHEAIRWLTSNSNDFRTVCHYAGMDPDYVRRKAKRSIAHPTSWRAEAGKGSRYAERKAYRKKIKERKALDTCDTRIDSTTVISGCWE